VSIPSFEVDQEQEKRDTSNKKEKEKEETNSVCVPSIVHKYKRVHKLVIKRE
jgi:hypothetical protein